MVTATAERTDTKGIEIDLTRVKCVRPSGATQEEFVFDRSPYVGWIGGRGCSKTTSGIFKLMEFIPQFPGAWCLVTEPSWRQLHTVALPNFRKWIPESWIKHEAKSGDKMWIDLYNGCRVLFCNASNVESIRGPEFAFWLADEIASCRRELIDVGMPCLRQPGYPHQFVFTGTPKGKNWVYRMFVDPVSRLPHLEGKEQISLYRATMYGNPFCPEDVKRRLEAQYANNPTLHAREIMGEFTDFEGLVFPSFDYNIHVKKPPEDVTWRRVIGGIDFGMSSPSAVLLMGMDTSGRRWFFKEFYKSHADLGVLSVASKWKADEHVRAFYCDPHMDKDIATLTHNGIPAYKGDARSIETRVRVINHLLGVEAGGPGLYISPDCPNLIDEMSTYSFSDELKGDEEAFSNVIKKKQADHAIDAMGYAVMGDYASQPRHNIKQIIFG